MKNFSRYAAVGLIGLLAGICYEYAKLTDATGIEVFGVFAIFGATMLIGFFAGRESKSPKGRTK